MCCENLLTINCATHTKSIENHQIIILMCIILYEIQLAPFSLKMINLKCLNEFFLYKKK